MISMWVNILISSVNTMLCMWFTFPPCFYITDPVCKIACNSMLIRADVASALYIINILEVILCILKYVHIIFIAVMHIYLVNMNIHVWCIISQKSLNTFMLSVFISCIVLNWFCLYLNDALPSIRISSIARTPTEPGGWSETLSSHMRFWKHDGRGDCNV